MKKISSLIAVIFKKNSCKKRGVLKCYHHADVSKRGTMHIVYRASKEDKVMIRHKDK